MERDKVESLIGFAVKAGKTVFGADSLQMLKKRVYLIFVDEDLAQNTLKRVSDWAVKADVPMLVSKKKLEEIVYKKNCKVFGLTDRQMAEAVQKNLSANYKQYVAEGK